MRSTRVVAAIATSVDGRVFVTAGAVCVLDGRTGPSVLSGPVSTAHEEVRVADKYPFLSDDWFSAVSALIEKHDAPAGHQNLKMNLVVTETPFDADRQFHMGSDDGKALFGPGHIDPADVTMTTDYQTAKDVFASGNPQAGMQAFMAGKVKVQGDMAKLMAGAAGGGGAAGDPDLTQAIIEVTE
jgi:putative sterol carrier protein